jgi:hypothetical protein
VEWSYSIFALILVWRGVPLLICNKETSLHTFDTLFTFEVKRSYSIFAFGVEESLFKFAIKRSHSSHLESLFKFPYITLHI